MKTEYTAKKLYECSWCGKKMTAKGMAGHAKRSKHCHLQAYAYCVKHGLSTAHL